MSSSPISELQEGAQRSQFILSKHGQFSCLAVILSSGSCHPDSCCQMAQEQKAGMVIKVVSPHVAGVWIAGSYPATTLSVGSRCAVVVQTSCSCLCLLSFCPGQYKEAQQHSSVPAVPMEVPGAQYPLQEGLCIVPSVAIPRDSHSQ